MKRRNQLKRTICFAAAATIATTTHQSNAFVNTNSQCTSTSTIPHHSTHSYKTNAAIHSNIIHDTNRKALSMSALSENIPQQETLPLIDSAEHNELSEFLGRNLRDDGRSINCDSDDSGFPLLMSLTDEQREFELKLGKALDTLRNDYPDMLKKDPDYSIYHSQIEVVDPKGITLHSLKTYKSSFSFLHTLINIFYSPDDSGLTFRLVYDCARKSIRVSWNAVLIPRMGGVSNGLHVDGISVYEFDRESGLINQHRVEHLLINDAPVEAPQGIFRLMATRAMEGGRDAEGIPVWNMEHKNTPGNILEFKPTSTFFSKSKTTSLFSSADAASDHPLFDQEAFERKNASRQKFGVPPLTPDEYINIQREVKAMESAAEAKAAALRQQKAAAEAVKPKQTKGKLFGKLFGDIFEDTCESNFDCERPEVCCDLGFKKMCCSSGMKIIDGQPNLQRIPLRVIADDGMYPRGGPEGLDDYKSY